MSNKILVAGGAGFIGSHLCEALSQAGHEVFAYDSLISARKENVAFLKSLGVQFVQHDIREPIQFSGALDQIFNLACPASPADFKTYPLYILETCSLGHKNLLELAKEKKATILVCSTSEIYGEAQEHPQRETYFGNVNTIGERSCYDEGKRYCEALSMVYLKHYGVQTRIARIFNTYGTRMRKDDGRILPNFFTQALTEQPLTIYGDGSQTRSYCYVTDLVAGLIALMNSRETLPVNLGNPIERTVLEMANCVNSLTGNRTPHTYLPLPENDPLQRCPDITRAKEILNWSPTVTLEEGLRLTLKYFKTVV